MIEAIKAFYLDKQYSNIVALTLNEQVNSFDDEILKVLAASYYHTHQKRKCLEILGEISNDFFINDYYLNEIKAECSLSYNKFSEAFFHFTRAIELNPSLVSAKYQRTILKLRLTGKIAKQEIDMLFELATKTKRQQWFREISYLYYHLGLFQKANQCLEKLAELGGKFHFLDMLTYTSFGMKNKQKHYSQTQPLQFERIIDEKFVKNANTPLNKHLVVVLSTQHTHAFQGYEFGNDLDVLFLADLTSSYYYFILNEVIESISDKLRSGDYEIISIVGVSKAGTGAFLVYQELAKLYDNLKINIIAFSPPIQIYPFNENLLIPSYQHFSKLIDIHPMAKHLVENINQPADIKKRKKDRIIVIYGNGYPMDVAEVKKIEKVTGIEIIPLNYNGHTTSIPYTIPNGKTLEDLKRIYKNLADLPDTDFQALGGGKIIDLVDQIWTLYQNPNNNLRHLLKEFEK